tara:strand:- start:151 stop:702 length:552 start_codon:yes stop_codon:yes gene_type:complete
MKLFKEFFNEGGVKYGPGGYDPNVRGWSGIIGPGVKRGKQKSKTEITYQDIIDKLRDIKQARKQTRQKKKQRNRGPYLNRLKEYMNIRPGDDSPMGATVHHYAAPRNLSPLTLQLLQLFSSQSGKAPADPDQHDGIKLFRQWPEHIQDLVLSDLSFLADKVPNPELKSNLTNMEKFLQLMRGK